MKSNLFSDIDEFIFACALLPNFVTSKTCARGMELSSTFTTGAETTNPFFSEIHRRRKVYFFFTSHQPRIWQNFLNYHKLLSSRQRLFCATRYQIILNFNFPITFVSHNLLSITIEDFREFRQTICGSFCVCLRLKKAHDTCFGSGRRCCSAT